MVMLPALGVVGLVCCTLMVAPEVPFRFNHLFIVKDIILVSLSYGNRSTAAYSYTGC